MLEGVRVLDFTRTLTGAGLKRFTKSSTRWGETFCNDQLTIINDQLKECSARRCAKGEGHRAKIERNANAQILLI